MSLSELDVLKFVKISKPSQKSGQAAAVAAMPVSSADAEALCKRLGDVVDNLVSQSCGKKKNVIEENGKGEGCACSGASSAAKAKVDLVIVIDTSGSMGKASTDASKAANNALSAASANCPGDHRVEWFGLNGTWPGTKFTTNSKTYLTGLPGVTAANLNAITGEDGAKAVGDFSRHFDWREGACRAILYISDEGLEHGDPHDAADDAAVAQAILDANANSVHVFTHRVSSTGVGNDPAKIASFKKLSTDTGGLSFDGPASVSDYETILENALCNACGTCKHVPIDDVEPCVSLVWGDSACDEMETSDYEKICFRICNCYDNISFENLSIKAVLVLDADGTPVATLPDGSPSVDITPFGPICFGDIGPCTSDGATCLSRQAVIRTCGAKPGDYIVAVILCYSISAHRFGVETFNLKLCAS